MKKIFLLMMAIALSYGAMAVNVWDGTSEPWTNGNGTVDDPYLIETASNLAYLAEKVNEGYQATGQAVFAGTYFLMTDDMDLDNLNWTPIGYVSYTNGNLEGFYFGGIFDGGYHEISNLKIQTNTEITGLFAGLADGSILEHLFVNRATITSTGMAAGGIAGGLAGDALLFQCGFSGNITVTNGGTYCGGGGVVAVAAQNSRIVECSFSGSISATNNGMNYTGMAGAGGIAGAVINEVAVEGCYNTGTVTATALMFGIAAGIVAATLQDNNVKIHSCYNVGSLNAMTKGGIFGMISPINPFRSETAISVHNCYFLNTTATANGYGVAKTSAEMKTEEFKDLLDQSAHVFVMDNGTNSGYPIHSLAGFGYLQATDITCFEAKLSAHIHQGNDTIARAYFIYKPSDTDEWIEVDVATDGYVEVELDSLMAATSYEYNLELLFADSIVMSGAPQFFQTEINYESVADHEASVKIYPNPAAEAVHIDGVIASEVRVFSVAGQLMKTVKGSNEINISDLPCGIYLLRITSAIPETEYVLPLSKHSH